MSFERRKTEPLDFVRSVYEPLRGVVVKCGAGRARQSMKAECDINTIVARYQKTGFIGHVMRGVPRYADVTTVTDYRDAIDRVRKANDVFMSLPAKVRAEFRNDPAEFLDYIGKAENLDALAARGLIVKEPIAAGSSAPAGAAPDPA